MGWFSKLRSGKPHLWREFDDMPNDGATLKRKANTLSLLLVQSSRNFAENLRQKILPQTDLGILHLECLAMDLHMIDRLAVQTLGEENRNTFQDALMLGVGLSLAMHPPSSQTSGRDSMASFIQLYNQRTMQYMDCEISPPKNEHGGLELERTFGFRLAQHLGVADDFWTAMHLMTDIAAHYIAALEHLQLRELLVGYQER